MQKEQNMPPALIDIGANLSHKSFEKDIEQVLDKARAAGVESIIVTGTNLLESEKAIELANQFPELLSATVGIHPHDASQFSNDSYQQLLSLSQSPAVVAIGETGLDFNRNFSSKEQQIYAFEQQLALAAERGLPLFLHEREAHKTQREMIQSCRNDLGKVVIHCFTGTRREAYRYLDLDLYIGITGWICDERRGRELQDLIADIPLPRIMIETDAPYLAPRVKPKPDLASSRRNEPCTLIHIAQAIAHHSGHSVEQVAHETTANARAFFGLSG